MMMAPLPLPRRITLLSHRLYGANWLVKCNGTGLRQRALVVAAARRRRRCSFSSKKTDGSSIEDDPTPSPVEIPAPTWSISDLQFRGPPVSEEQLSKWAKRAVLAVDPSDAELRQELGNMVHMIQQVRDFEYDEEEDLTEEEQTAALYDVPRGVVAAPVREDIIKDEGLDTEWMQYVKPHMTTSGGYHYFEIATKQEKKELEKDSKAIGR